MGTGRERLRFPQPYPAVTSLAFAADNRLLLLGMSDGKLLVWDLVAGKEIDQLTGHRGRIHQTVVSPDGSRVGTAGEDTAVLVWDLAHLSRKRTLLPARLEPKELPDLWTDLADADARRALRAVWLLAAAPAQTVPFLREHLRPAPAIDPERITRLIADLDDDTFAVREQASKELAALGPLVESALQKALQTQPSPEKKRRLEELLDRLKAGGLSVERSRALRATEVLERIGTAEARQLLEELAKGGPGAWLTEEAKSVLGRMGKRPTHTPW